MRGAACMLPGNVIGHRQLPIEESDKSLLVDGIVARADDCGLAGSEILRAAARAHGAARDIAWRT